jgi:tetratricopeptide (TPR) repeat protein
LSAVARRYYVRGKAALDKNDLDTALEALRAAIDLVPAFSGARVAYAVALCRYGDVPRAAQILRAGLARPASPVAAAALWAALGDALTMAGDFLGAEDAFRQAEQHPAFAGRAAAGLARTYAKLGRYPDSFAHLARAAAMNKELEAKS